MNKLVGCAVFLALAVVSRIQAEDWPQWGGPDRDHVSKEKGLLQDWPSAGPKQVWLNSTAGAGYSGIAVVNGRIYTMGLRGERDYLIALDAKDGKEIWATVIGPTFSESHGDGPRGTPTVQGDRVFALNGEGILIAANTQDGKPLWKKTMRELGGNVATWGYTESLYVDDQNVYCTPGGSKGAIAALDARTGEMKWQTKDFTAPAHYSSMVPAQINGTRQLVQLMPPAVVGVAPEDGKVLWQSDWHGRTAVIPSPVVHDNYVYITSGYGAGDKLVKINPGNKPETIYDHKVMKNHHGGVVLVGDYLYGYSDGSGWLCQKFLTGEQVWASKNLGKGAVLAAGDRLYCLDENTGTVVLAEASPKGWQDHGRFTLKPQSAQRSREGKVWTHPVIANGKLYLRDQEYLFCFNIATTDIR
ncbi:MAG TPA: PQQ-binding-like beta-propeller repeat protein [Verrucomicrobiae bacterium]|jgi:outer membrane protein assembly factor BamB|nr:PQQ-binding-like beta-propeller repeat protein [Verrucomicrobiae bacterium]